MGTQIQRERLHASPALRRYDDIRELIANPANPTPLLRLGRLIPCGTFELYLKLEGFNPFGSIKDRAALYMLKGLRERGELGDRELVEPTSGNTRIALAAQLQGDDYCSRHRDVLTAWQAEFTTTEAESTQ